MTAMLEADVYPAALRVDEIFVDPTYQRVLEVSRARKMCAEWNPRLAGMLEVSDRGCAVFVTEARARGVRVGALLVCCGDCDRYPCACEHADDFDVALAGVA